MEHAGHRDAHTRPVVRVDRLEEGLAGNAGGGLGRVEVAQGSEARVGVQNVAHQVPVPHARGAGDVLGDA